MTTPPTTIRQWMTNLKGVVESAGLKLSPAALHANAIPKQATDLSFSLNIQSSNTGEYRTDDYLVRAEHEVEVVVLKRLKPLAQFDSYLDMADIEAALNDKLLPRSALPDTEVTWTSTDRTLSRTREWLLLTVTYTCVVDQATGATP